VKNKILRAITGLILFLMPNVSFGQAPVLGHAAGFVLFTTNGAMTCSGTKYLTHLTGDVGSNLAGSTTGFGNVDGVMHTFDVASGLCTPDVISLYTQLSTAIPTATLATPFGSGTTLFAGVYHLIGASTLTSTLILDGQGNPNAQFIFQIGGLFSTNASSKIKLINGALACNVFWQVGGAVNVGTGTYLRGTIVANGQIDMTSTLDTLEGRALALNAAVLVSQLVAYTPIGCGSPYLTGPAAPPMLDSTAAYGVFSSIGAVTSTPVTYVIGSVGANSTAPTGFNPLNVTGAIHSMDPSTAAAAADLTNIYNYLVALPADIDLLDPSDFGHDLVLTPHSYQITGITPLTGNLYLNAEGNPNAVFVIKINGAVTSSTLSHIMLINGTQAKNVYWKIDGAVDIFSNSVFNGTMVVGGAISLETGDTLNGRALTINGAIAINGSYVKITPRACTAPVIGGVMHACVGSTSTLTDSTPGGKWTSADTTIATIDSNSGMATGIRSGNASITYTTSAGCTNSASFTVNGAPSAITGPNNVCIGSSITLIDTTIGGTWSSSNTLLATVGSLSGIVTGVAAGTPVITYTIPTGCIATKSIIVNPLPNAGSISGPSSVCVGSSIILTDGTPGGIWSSSNTSATVAGGLVTGISAGIDTINYSVTNTCGTAAATKTIAVNSLPNAGIITGASTVCVGSSITLNDGVSGGTWSSSNTSATVAGGIVTGVSAGIDTISYSVTSTCGTAATSKTITVNPLPNAGSISGPSSVCVGSSILLTDGAPGGTWSSSNANATVSGGLVTGVSAGSNVISYTVINTCGSASATHALVVMPLANAGSISGPSSVCVGSAIALTDGVPGGVWSSSNFTASIGTSGVVTGVTAGLDTIVYTYTNACGTDATTHLVTVNPLPNAGSIAGPSTVCVASSITLTDGVAGGTWSSSNTALATAGSISGIVTGIAAGVPFIMYSVTNMCGTATATHAITVNPLPFAGSITGASSVCVASSTTLTDPVTGGTWSSSNANATVAGGVVTGISAGAVAISYSVTNMCGTISATKALTVNPLPNAGTIIGASSVCVGVTITLTDGAAGGTWSSSNTSATVAGGVVTGIIPGTDTIGYTVTNMCGTTAATKQIIVNAQPDAGTITGASAVCAGSSITLSDLAPGGTWSGSNTVASVGTTGVVTGVSAGSAIINYTVINVCGTAMATKTILVNPLPLVPVITTQAPSTACTGTMFQNFGTSNPPQVGTTYSWTAINAIVWAQGTAHQYALINFTKTGTAYITLNATFAVSGCTNKTTTAAVTVGATEAQIATVSYFNNHFVCTPADEDSYQWGYDDAYTLDSTILPGEINQDYINVNPDLKNKKYWAMTTLGGCLQKTYYEVPTNVQNVNSDAGVSVYPNPAASVINVVISSSVQGQVQLEILNMLGQRMTSIATTDNKATIDVAGLPAGSYLVICYNDGIKIATARFIKN